MKTPRCFPVLLLAIITSVGSLSAQNASYNIVGSGCRLGPTPGVVPFSVQGLPRLGSTFTVITEGSGRYVWGGWRRTSIMIGLSNTSAGGFSLPFDIRQLFPNRRFYCGMLRTSIEAMIPVQRVVNINSLVRVDFQVPNVIGLLGARFYQQVISVEGDTFGHAALALSAGGEGVIGR